MSEELNFEADSLDLVQANTEGLTTLNQLVLQQLDLEAQVASKEQELKDVKDRLRRIQEVALPEAMDSAGVPEFKTSTGLTVTVKEDISISLAGDKKVPALAWLKEHGLGDLVTSNVTVPFGKGQLSAKDHLLYQLRDQGFSFTDAEDANSASVKAALKRRLEAGEAVDLTIFGGHRWRKAQIKLK